MDHQGSGYPPCLSLIIHHTDGDRGYAHDRKSRFGKLGKGQR